MNLPTPNQTHSGTGFRLELERTINAPIEDVFDVLLDETGPSFESPDGHALSLKLEPFPGGRWYRDLGDGNGHSHVRAAMLGPDITVPVRNGSLLLGTWQQIILVEFDTKSRNRKIHLTAMGEGALKEV